MIGRYKSLLRELETEHRLGGRPSPREAIRQVEPRAREMIARLDRETGGYTGWAGVNALCILPEVRDDPALEAAVIEQNLRRGLPSKAPAAWFVWRTHLDGGRVRVTVAAEPASWKGIPRRATQARYQRWASWRRSWDMPCYALRDGAAWQTIRRAIRRDPSAPTPNLILDTALRERGILPGGERKEERMKKFEARFEKDREGFRLEVFRGNRLRGVRAVEVQGWEKNRLGPGGLVVHVYDKKGQLVKTINVEV